MNDFPGYEYAPKPVRDRLIGAHSKQPVPIEKIDKMLGDFEQAIVDTVSHDAVPTKRMLIADLIRGLTYRELCQMADEIKKCEQPVGAAETNMAATLDVWAHMVKDEVDDGINRSDDTPT